MNAASFGISRLAKQRQDSVNSWLEFLNLPTLSMGIYHIPAGTDDRESHTPHEKDEVYVGLRGKGRLTADGKQYDVDPDTIVFVKAGVEHFFHDVADDLTVLVFFSGNANDE